jgi:hypothetical protein
LQQSSLPHNAGSTPKRKTSGKKNIENLKDDFGLQNSITKNNFAIQEALLNAHISNTKQDELSKVSALNTVSRTYYQSEITRSNEYYDKQIALADEDAVSVAKLTLEKSKAVSDINKEYQLNEIETQKKIAELEKQILNDRRKALIDFKNIQIDASKFALDASEFAISRGVERGTISAEAGYDKLKSITNSTYDDIIAKTKEAYDLQLQDTALTSEQITNLKAQAALEETKITEDRNRRILQLDDDLYQKQIEKIKNKFQQMRDEIQSNGDLFSALQGTFSTSIGTSGVGLLGQLGIRDSRREQKSLSGRIGVLSGQIDHGNILSAASGTLGSLGAIDSQLDKLGNARAKLVAELKLITDGIPSGIFKLADLLDQSAAGVFVSADKLDAAFLEIQQAFERQDLEAQLSEVRALTKKASEAGDLDQVGVLNAKLGVLLNQKTTQAFRQQAASIDLYNNSLDGLNEAIRKLQTGDTKAVGDVVEAAQKSIASEHKQLLEDNISLEVRYAAIGEDAADRYRNAWLQALYDVRNATIEARESQIKSQVEIADQTVFNADRARAGILEAMAGAKGYTEIFQDAFLSINDALGDGFGKLFGGLEKHLGAVGKIIADVGTNLLKMVTNRLMIKLLDAILPGGGGGASSGAAAPSVGGFFGLGGTNGGGSGINIGNLLGGLLRPGAAGSGAGGGQAQLSNLGLLSVLANGGALGGGGGSTLSGADLLSAYANIPSSNIGEQGRSLPSSGGGFLSGLAKLFGGGAGGVGAGLAGLAPLLGAGLGSSLGGSSLTGSILGGLGGAAAGITGLIGLGALGIGGTAISGVLGGITGALGISLATLGPIAAIAAPALLLGAFFLGRDKRRKQAEVQRTQYITDALKQLDEVLVNVRGHKYDSGQEAIDAANSIKESYRQSANSITDTKTRNIALKEITDRIDPKIAEITAAAGQLDGARTHFNDLVPEFATGGIVPGQFGSPRLVLAHGGEIIANMSQQTPDLLNAAAKAGIPGVRGDAGSGSGSGSVNVELFVGKEMQNELFVNGAKSSKGASVLRQQNQKTSAFDDRTTSF